MRFSIGDMVYRVEAAREQCAAVIISSQTLPDGTVYEIAYAEGGTGWWPEHCLSEERP